MVRRQLPRRAAPDSCLTLPRHGLIGTDGVRSLGIRVHRGQRLRRIRDAAQELSRHLISQRVLMGLMRLWRVGAIGMGRWMALLLALLLPPLITASGISGVAIPRDLGSIAIP